MQIKYVKKASSSLVIEVNSDEDLKKMESHTGLKKNFEVEKPSRQNPRVIIYDVSTLETAERVVAAQTVQGRRSPPMKPLMT